MWKSNIYLGGPSVRPSLSHLPRSYSYSSSEVFSCFVFRSLSLVTASRRVSHAHAAAAEANYLAIFLRLTLPPSVITPPATRPVFSVSDAFRLFFRFSAPSMQGTIKPFSKLRDGARPPDQDVW